MFPLPTEPMSHNVAGSSTSLEADQYINSKFQIGSLSSIQPCDELSSLVLFEAWVGFYQLPSGKQT